MTPVWLFGIAGFLVVGVAIFAVWMWGTANATTVIVIRHADKEAGNLVDPQLSAAGEARAALLERMAEQWATGVSPLTQTATAAHV